MKILVAADAYKFLINGASNLIATMVNELRKGPNEVKVLAMSNNTESFKDGDDYYFGSVPALVYPNFRLSFVRNDPLLKELIEWKPDLIHLHSEASAERLARIVAEACDAPIIMTAHTDYEKYVFGRFSDTTFANFIIRTWGKITYKGVDTVIAPSEKVLSFEQLKDFSNQIVVIPNGIPLEQYQKEITAEEKAELFKKYELKDNGKTMLIVSRISKEKNIKEILFYLPELLDRDPEIQLLIVGGGPEKGELEAYCRRHDLSGNVRFTGLIPVEEVYRYYHMGDVFVSASTFEVHSLTYLEALACGLPLVCRKDPCLKGVLKNGVNGFTFENGQEFADSIISIFNNPGMKQELKRNALKTASGFSEKALAERTLALYEEVLQRCKNTSGQGQRTNDN